MSATSIERGNPARRGNNFNALRLIAASLVILSHGIELPTGLAARDWAHAVTGRTFSWYAVSLFFVISGYLIVLSWERQRSLAAFTRARLLRIWPGLIVMLLVTVPLLGFFFSKLSFAAYLTEDLTWRYFAGCASVIFTQYFLPQVFGDNPLQVVNGSLWTLRYEIFCYAAVAVAGVLGLLRAGGLRRACALAAVIGGTAIVVAIDLQGQEPTGKTAMLYELGRLGLCFFLGALYCELQGRLPLRFSVVAALIAASAIGIGTPAFTPLASITVAYAAFWFAYVPDAAWIAKYRTAPDYSYGLYIYAFPVQQALLAAVPGMGPLANICLGFVATLILAAMSWHVVEKPMLAFKRWPPAPAEASEPVLDRFKT